MKAHPGGTLGTAPRRHHGDGVADAHLTAVQRLQLLWVAVFAAWAAARLTMGPEVVSMPPVWVG